MRKSKSGMTACEWRMIVSDANQATPDIEQIGGSASRQRRKKNTLASPTDPRIKSSKAKGVETKVGEGDPTLGSTKARYVRYA